MPNVAHFAINADNVPRAKRFYERVFGWTFSAWGPPDFYQIQTGTRSDPGVRGALQKRRELVSGTPMIGFECTISVDSIDATAKAVAANGGKTIMEKSTIVGVGTLMFFQDTEGNAFGAIQFDPKAD
jgi:predicted enzyme related to lactoylglutathione lyase